MTEVCYIAPEALDADEDAHAFLRVGDAVHIVPALPEVERLSDDRIYFNGPLVGALYGGTYLSPRTKGLIRSTLAHNPDYFKRLGARIRATNSLAPIATVVPALDMKKKRPNRVTRRHK
tara:strand:+ start:1016 stop:1372 length:357 start_codon:yes stop_codon:yes gene_type:complete